MNKLILFTAIFISLFADKTKMYAKGELTPGIQLYNASNTGYMNINQQNYVALNIYYSGTEDKVNYTVAIEMDGKRIVEQNITRTTPIYDAKDTIRFNLKDIDLGEHTLKIYIDASKSSVQISKNSEIIQNKVILYSQSVKRQKFLIEQFTSVDCRYCPSGSRFIKHFIKNRNDIALVAIHGGVGDDPMSVYPLCYNIWENHNVTGLPAASFNRTIDGNGRLSMPINFNEIGFNSLNEHFSKLFDSLNKTIPSFVTLNIQTNMLNNSNINITIEGKGVEQAPKIINGQKLYVYITEDGIISPQFDDGITIPKYVHNNVLRNCLSDINGDEIKWDGDNFKHTYTYKLTNKNNPKNMHVVAFIAPPLNDPKLRKTFTKYIVNQANIKGISTTNSSNNINKINICPTIEYYSIMGQKVNAPIEGNIYIVKYKNGKTKKILYK